MATGGCALGLLSLFFLHYNHSTYNCLHVMCLAQTAGLDGLSMARTLVPSSRTQSKQSWSKASWSPIEDHPAAMR